MGHNLIAKHTMKINGELVLAGRPFKTDEVLAKKLLKVGMATEDTKKTRKKK